MPFDFEYALYLHSGLRGWVPVSGDPENFIPGVPVRFVQKSDQFVQRAEFMLDAEGNVSMVMNDRMMIACVELPYMRFLYAGGDDAEGQ